MNIKNNLCFHNYLNDKIATFCKVICYMNKCVKQRTVSLSQWKHSWYKQNCNERKYEIKHQSPIKQKLNCYFKLLPIIVPLKTFLFTRRNGAH